MIFKGRFQPKPFYESMMTAEKAGNEAFFLVACLSSSSMASQVQVIPPFYLLFERELKLFQIAEFLL